MIKRHLNEKDEKTKEFAKILKKRIPKDILQEIEDEIRKDQGGKQKLDDMEFEKILCTRLN